MTSLTAPPFPLYSSWYTRSLFRSSIVLFLIFWECWRSLSLTSSVLHFLFPLEVFLLGYEQLLGSWIPYSNSMESTLFQLCSGFASGFLIHPVEENAPTLGKFEIESTGILLWKGHGHDQCTMVVILHVHGFGQLEVVELIFGQL